MPHQSLWHGEIKEAEQSIRKKRAKNLCKPVIWKRLDRQENNQGARGWMICLRNWQTA